MRSDLRRRSWPPRFALATSLLAALLLITVTGGAASPAGWETVGQGISYQVFTLSGPNRVYTARMDRSNPSVTIDSMLAHDSVGEGRETVSDMAERNDGALSAWGGTWGARNHVVVAVNGSFFDVETGVANNGQVQSGWYAKPFSDLGGWSGFAWKLDRSAFIGECVNNPSADQVITNLMTGKELRINGINDHRARDELVVYTPQHDYTSRGGRMAAELLVQLIRPLMVASGMNGTLGVVREIREGDAPMQIPFDHIVVSGAGRSRDNLLANFRRGDIVRLSLQIDSYASDCRTPLSQDWSGTYASVGGNFYFLKDGRVQPIADPGATARNPRTAICYNRDFIYFLVVDGRQPGYSVGMTTDELGAFCRDHLDAAWGINQDGGGSSTFWLNGQVVNQPSDGSEREVANGLMMVVVEPEEHSYAFRVGDEVKLASAANLYLGPGSNFPAFTSASAGAEGLILRHLTGLNGVQAKGAAWWRVRIGPSIGWVAEEHLELARRGDRPATSLAP